jgi:hypothetical protein
MLHLIRILDYFQANSRKNLPIALNEQLLYQLKSISDNEKLIYI